MLASSLLRTLVACFLAGVAGAAMAGDLVVSAASSLTNAFKDIAQSYEAQHPGSKVLLNFGASGALLQQMAKGAPVDVFASADQETMDAAQQQGLVRAVDRQDFVRNALVVVAPMDAKASPAALKDLVGPGVARVALALPASVPVGRYGKHALEAAGLAPLAATAQANAAGPAGAPHGPETRGSLVPRSYHPPGPSRAGRSARSNPSRQLRPSACARTTKQTTAPTMRRSSLSATSIQRRSKPRSRRALATGSRQTKDSQSI